MLLRFSIAIGRLPLIFAIVLLSACTKMEIEDHSLQFNEAVGSLDNRLLLLNAVRASKDYPVRFSVIQAYTGTSRWDGTYAPEVPFPIRADRSYKLLPSFNFSPGIESLQIADLNSAKAQSQLKKKLSFNDWYYYLTTGRDAGVTTNLFVESISVHFSILSHMLHNMEQGCRSPKIESREEVLCPEIDKFALACAGTADRIFAFRKFAEYVRGHLLFAADNTPIHKCAHLRFKALLAVLIINEFSVEPYEFRNKAAKTAPSSPTKSAKVDGVDVNVNVTLGNKEAASASTARIFFAFVDPGLTALVEQMLKRKDLDRDGINPFDFRLRSPESMVRYLGEVIAAEVYQEEQYQVTIAVRGDKGGIEVPLFPVERGAGTLGGAAVSVRDPEGETFSVPVPVHGSPERHRGLVALGLVQEVIGAAVSTEALPPVRNVIFTPSR